MKYNHSQALQKIAAYCSVAERAEFDVKRKLQSWEMDDATIESIIVRLKKEKFLSEDRFCNAFIRDKIRFNGWGKSKIVLELKRKQVSESSIRKSFSEIDTNLYDEKLKIILLKKLKTLDNKKTYETRVKLIRFALGRGFDLEQVQKVVSDLINETEDEYLD